MVVFYDNHDSHSIGDEETFLKYLLVILKASEY